MRARASARRAATRARPARSTGRRGRARTPAAGRPSPRTVRARPDGVIVASVELVALVKHDCPVCDQVLPALDAAGVRVRSQSSAEETAAQAARLGLARVPDLDDDLALSERLDPDAVPALVLLDGER